MKLSYKKEKGKKKEKLVLWKDNVPFFIFLRCGCDLDVKVSLPDLRSTSCFYSLPFPSIAIKKFLSSLSPISSSLTFLQSIQMTFSI